MDATVKVRQDIHRGLIVSKGSLLVGRETSIPAARVAKLDVLDGLPEILIGTGYRLGGRVLDVLPLDADEIAACEPIYEKMPGWTESTAGVTNWELLPLNARRYLERMQALIGAPIDMVSTGPDRVHTVLLRHPFRA